MLHSIHFQHSFFSISISAYSSSSSFFLPVLCLPVVLSSFCPISKSPYEPNLLSLKSNAVSFNGSWIDSHSFHLPIIFFPASSDCPPLPSSCLHACLLCMNFLNFSSHCSPHTLLLQLLLVSFLLFPIYQSQGKQSA